MFITFGDGLALLQNYCWEDDPGVVETVMVMVSLQTFYIEEAMRYQFGVTITCLWKESWGFIAVYIEK